VFILDNFPGRKGGVININIGGSGGGCPLAVIADVNFAAIGSTVDLVHQGTVGTIVGALDKNIITGIINIIFPILSTINDILIL